VPESAGFCRKKFSSTLSRAEAFPGLPRFNGGLVAIFGYDLRGVTSSHAWRIVRTPIRW